jgi:hypothetical protein
MNTTQHNTTAQMKTQAKNEKRDLLTSENAKTSKGENLGFLTGILYLAPANESGKNTCPFASTGCAAACLFTAGRGAFDSVREARLAKTYYLWQGVSHFIDNLELNVHALERKAKREGLTPCVRPNGTSDLPWETMKGNKKKSIIALFPHVQFYDYTKNPSRMKKYLRGEMPANYHLTFSRSECNHDTCLEILAMGGNVAVVFEKMPQEWCGREVISGDDHDLRFLDKAGVVVGLKAKGKAKKDISGFVIPANG